MSAMPTRPYGSKTGPTALPSCARHSNPRIYRTGRTPLPDSRGLEGFQTPYEDEYQMRQVTGIHHDWLIGLPLLAEVSGIGWIAVTEADIDHYAGMYLRKDKPAFSLCAE